jgi:hypothetical protein
MSCCEKPIRKFWLEVVIGKTLNIFALVYLPYLFRELGTHFTRQSSGEYGGVTVDLSYLVLIRHDMLGSSSALPGDSGVSLVASTQVVPIGYAADSMILDKPI